MNALSTVERRALDRICTEKGRLLIVAADQRNGMRAAMAGPDGDPADVSDDELFDAKLDMVSFLGNAAPAILLDPEVAVPQVIDRSVLSPRTALVVGMDASGFEVREGLRYTRFVDGVTPEAVRWMGGDCAKMLWYMRSDCDTSDVVAQIRELCAEAHRAGVLLIVEILAYRFEGETAEEYEALFPELIRGAAELCVQAGARVLKLPYPGSAEACRAVTAAAHGVPWAVLSAGVDHRTFIEQVEVAVANGASGAMAGRSLWKDALGRSHAVREERLRALSAPRLEELRRAVDS